MRLSDYPNAFFFTIDSIPNILLKILFLKRGQSSSSGYIACQRIFPLVVLNPIPLSILAMCSRSGA